jgi:hypothetical protein
VRPPAGPAFELAKTNVMILTPGLFDAYSLAGATAGGLP